MTIHCELGDTSTVVDPSVFEAIRASNYTPQLSTEGSRHG